LDASLGGVRCPRCCISSSYSTALHPGSLAFLHVRQKAKQSDSVFRPTQNNLEELDHALFVYFRHFFFWQKSEVSRTFEGEFMEKLKNATLGGGCFWCLEAVYSKLEGVKSVAPGYAGGTKLNPTYEQVCTGNTGHAEVIQIDFDPQKTSYETLLDWFWRCHDPTTLNRQGGDIGTQYRSVIFYENEAQKTTANESKKDAEKSGMFDAPIVTEFATLPEFYPAEDYHQDYYSNNPNAGYCTYVIRPKLAKLNLE